MTHRYHGELVLLGTRTTRLPNDDDLATMHTQAGKYAPIDAVMPEKGDIITISGHDGEWFVKKSGQASTWNWRMCHLYKVTGRSNLVLSQHTVLRIAYDDTGLQPDFQGCVNNKQVLHDAVAIVGQASVITQYVRTPSLPDGVGLV